MMVYLDYNATTPLEKEVAEAMMPYLLEHFGNPSSSHYYGKQAKEAVDKARRQVSEFLGCSEEEIIFTSGGTESNNYAIKGAAHFMRSKGDHIITSSIEHPAVTKVCKYLKNYGFRTTYVPVDEDGIVNPDDVMSAITPGTILITIMHANNEVGSIQPIKEISEIARGQGILFHTDAAQSAGKIPVKVDKLGVDMMSLAGHKIYAPKGVGVLYIHKGIQLKKQMHGAQQEFGFRAGTENVLEIVGFGAACEIANERLEEFSANMKEKRDLLYKLITDRVPDLRLNGPKEKRLPNTLSISFRDIKADELLDRLDNVAASAGAACHSDSVVISDVLKAMKVPLEYAQGTVRLSTGRHTTTDEIETAADSIVEAVNYLRNKD